MKKFLLSFRWNKWTVAIVLCLTLAWGVHASWDYNDGGRLDHQPNTLRADASGYYIYLPGTFQYGFRAARVDPGLEEKVGHGFSTDRVRDRIVTKYFYGSAVLQAPFYLVAEIMVGWGTTDGFSPIHHRAVEAAAMFYWAMALLLLALACQHLQPAAAWVAPVVMAAITFGSNVFYYALRAPGYSHIYSFFLVSLAIWCLVTGSRVGRGGWKRWVFHWACAMIFWSRPVDAIAIGGMYVWLFTMGSPIVRSMRFWIEAAGLMLLVAVPQMCYWHFVHGKWIVYAYGNEGFPNWARPDMIRELFAPMNGWISHAPIALLLPLALWGMWRTQRALAIIILGVLSLAVYACAAWSSWHFGCSYGLRPMVQYMPFLAVAVWSFLARNGSRAYAWRCSVLPLLVILSYVNYRVMLQCGSCYEWDEWNWSGYVFDITHAFFGRLGSDVMQ